MDLFLSFITSSSLGLLTSFLGAAQLAEPHVLKGLNPVPFLPHDLVPVAALVLALGAIELAGLVQLYPQQDCDILAWLKL